MKLWMMKAMFDCDSHLAKKLTMCLNELSLGASVCVMPLSIFNSLSLGPLQSTYVVIHLANKSVAYPAGFIEDVLVWVGELIFPADFYVLDMEEGFSRGSVPIILGRPFMKTGRT